jgi:hypothetical protein
MKNNCKCFHLESVNLISGAKNGSIIQTCKGVFLKVDRYLIHVENGHVGEWTIPESAGKVVKIWMPKTGEGPCFAAIQNLETLGESVTVNTECEL